MSLNFNINPYYDDFDETKNYHRILFRPGYAVQARELTQLQTQIQDQINKFGKHIFVNGSVVVGGGRLFENDILSIKLDSSYAGASVDYTKFDGAIIVGATSQTKAIVKLVIGPEGVDPITLLVKVISGSGFTAAETISTDAAVSYSAKIQTSNPFNDAIIFSVDTGVYFIDGKFVYVEAQTIPVEKYTKNSSKNIGFLVDESEIDSDADTSLLDRAQGTTNYAAPGANRYGVTLTLISKALTSSVDNFVEIARVVDGALVVNKDKTIYSEIGKELARRTFDESGDYTVKKWPIQILDHQVTGATGPDSTKFTVALDPGKGYVKGYEYETINQEFLTLDRARDTATSTGENVSVSYGNYLNVTNVYGVFTTNASSSPYTSVELHNAARASVSSSTTKIGTAKVRFMRWTSGTGAKIDDVYKMYLFNISIDSGKFFKDVESIIYTSGSGAYVTSGADIDLLSKVGGSSGGDVYLSGQDSPGLVFPLASEYVKTISNTEYRIQRTLPLSFTSGVAYSTLSTGEQWVGAATVSSDDKNTHYHIVCSGATGATGFAAGAIIDMTYGSRSITKSGTANVNQQLTVTVENTVAGAATMIASIDLSSQSSSTRTKALSGYSIKILGTGLAGGLNTTTGGKDSLGISDIYEVSGVYNTGTTNPTAVTINSTTGALTWGAVSSTDVTANYSIDDGQRAEFYDHGNLVLKGTAPTATHYLLVVYRSFTHTGSGFLSRDSYSISYEDIPAFTDPSTGKVYQLRDCIDFRPKRDNGASTLSNGQIPDPSGTFEATYDYYLGRFDKVIATSDKQFIVKKGVSAVYPTVPSDESNGMSLYVLGVPPYTADVKDIQIKYIDNKRYTMRDIGKLEKRINNLEYYTQLTLLEKQAKDTSIPDSTNQEKFKNGFAVDPFTSADIFSAAASTWAGRRWSWWSSWFNGSNSWSAAASNYNDNSIAQAANTDFKCAIDPINQELRAPFTVNFNGFDTSTTTNTVKTGDLVTLDFDEATVIEQPLATTYTNINPFNVVRFVGSITLEPAFDQWVETTYLPAVNKLVDVQLQDAADINQTVVTGRYGGAKIWQTTSVTTTTTTNVLGSTTTNLGTSVVDIQYIPFMRANTVIGVAKTFKPKSQLFPFVENTSISAFVKPLKVITVQNHTGAYFNDTQGVYEALTIHNTSSTGVQTGTAKTAIYSQPTTDDITKRLLTVFDTTGTIAVGQYVVGANGGYGVITAVTTPSLGDSLIPDEYGNIGFEFQIPANTFKTGERTIRLIDNSNNDVEAQESIGEAKYTAIGTLQTKQETLLTTRSVQRQKRTITSGYYHDPTAQTFLVDDRANPQGFHVSSIDVYFKSKSSTVPVTLEIRRTVNGYPESVRTIPFAEVILNPEDVSISDDASVATTFNFANPIHLSPNEYAIVLTTNSNDYQVFISEIGGTQLGSTIKVDKQPYIGSLFKSQNASTWEPDQNKDLKFTIRRADFVSSGTVEFNVTDPDALTSYQTLFVKTSTILPTGTTVDWDAKAWYGGSAFDTAWVPININQDINYDTLRQLAAAASTGTGAPSLRLRATLTTDNTSVSPAVDAAALSVVTALNDINNLTTNESGTKSGGSASAKYITKPISLADGFDASNLCVTVDINMPTGTSVKVYYKTLPTEKTTPIDDESWVLMDQPKPVPASITAYDFKEYRFFPSGAFNAYGVPLDSPITTRFNSFQIKIVMLSSSQAATPRLRDLRIIALDS